MNNVIVSCEHGGYKVPEEMEHILSACETILKSHEGYDLGALDIANYMALHLNAHLFINTWTRLAIDVNRSRNNPSRFSRFSAGLSKAQRTILECKYYDPYRQTLQNAIMEALLKQKPIFHFSVHTFVPVLHGKRRTADIGILYDPVRQCEKHFAIALKEKLVQGSMKKKIKFNYPYYGTSDGIASFMRKECNSNEYVGIELEINQSLCEKTDIKNICAYEIVSSLKELLK